MALIRLLVYWMTIFAACWTLAFIYFCNAEKAFRRFDNASDKVKNIDNSFGEIIDVLLTFVLGLHFHLAKIFNAIRDEKVLEWATKLIGFMTPLLITASLATLFLTNETLPFWRFSYINKLVSRIRTFRSEDAELGTSIYKKNQFVVGYPNFNHIAFWFTLLPGMIYFLTFAKINLVYHVDDDIIPMDKSQHQFHMECISNTAAWAGTIVLSFFLIPVTRHSVLLVALNWSPIHALRIHIWAGYTSFLFIFIHGIIWVYVWFRWAKGPVYKEFIPSLNCWKRDHSTELFCKKQFYNFTGMVAFSFFFVLWITSFSWFRRKYYTLFYVIHVSCGSLMMLASIWHFEYIALYLLPSILYYLVSTMPTLVQAIASYMRSGVQVAQVVALEDAGDCFEVRFQANQHAKEILAGNHPSLYLKFCCPSLSLVWHPFTVFHHPDDSETLRLLIRPVGKFTKALREKFLTSTCPVMLIDGLYRGGDHSEQALQCHDHLSVITGGVAITPVISTMFVILKKLKQSIDEQGKSTYGLKSMTLIWSCREVGLVSYVKREYLDHMARIAFDIPEFELTIKLYYTGGNTKTPSNMLNTTMEKSETEYTSDRTTTTDAGSSHHSVNSERNVDQRTITNITKTKQSDQVKQLDSSVRQNLYFPDREGHAMEVARMMPARHSNIVSNLPLYLVMTGSTWLGFHIMFATYDYYPNSHYNEKSEQVWVTLLLISFYIVVGLTIEGVSYVIRTNGMDCSCDNVNCQNTMNTGGATVPYQCQIDSMDVDKCTESIDVYYNIFEEYYSRPNEEEYLLDAQTSSTPAIFLCAPVPMAESVQQAVQKENSSLLLTRYVVYEESFVM